MKIWIYVILFSLGVLISLFRVYKVYRYGLEEDEKENLEKNYRLMMIKYNLMLALLFLVLVMNKLDI